MNITQKAMLIHLKVSGWSGRRKDRQVTKEVNVSKKTSSDAGAWWTYLIPKKEMNKIEVAAGRCRATHDRLTLPWLDGGIRILPAKALFSYTAKMREVKAEYDAVIEDFLKHYDETVVSAKKRLGALAENVSYPSAKEIKSKFEITQEFIPMPSLSDFRVEVSEEDSKYLKEQVEQTISEGNKKASQELWNRLSELVEKVEGTLKEPDKKFKNSLIGNLKDFCKAIPDLNIMEDTNLESLRVQVKNKLTKLDPDNLRKNKKERKTAHADALAVLEKIKAYTNI
jgi:hypothetical protein